MKRRDFIAILFSMMIGASALAANGVPALLPFQGRVTDAAGNPINYPVEIKFRIYPSSGSCYLYEEVYSTITPNAYGIFSVMLGSGTKTGPNTGFTQVFSNDLTTPLVDSCGNTVSQAANDWRRLEMVVDGTALAMQTIGASAYALNAQQLEGKTSSDFILKTANVTQSRLDSLLNAGDASSLHHHDSLYIRKDGTNSFTGNVGTSGNIYTTSAAGYLGIGISTPAADIHVKKDSPTIKLEANVGQSGNPRLDFYGGSSLRGRIEASEGTNGIKFYSGATQAFAVDASGNLILNASMKAAGTVGIGQYTSAQEPALITSLTALGAAGAGTLWMNTTTQSVRYWNGSAATTIATGNSVVTSVTAGTGLSISGAATTPTILLADTAVAAGTYGAAGSVGTFTVDAQGRLTAAASTPILIMADQISSAAGKYLSYRPNNVACADQEILKWDATNSRWICAADAGGVAAEADPTVTAWAKSAPSARFVTTGNVLDLTASGVSAGTYSKVTVDTYGRVTASGSLTATDISTALGFNPLNKAGDTMSGLLVLSADPSTNLGASTKQYVDSAVSSAGGNYIRKDGTVAFTGDQSMGSHRLMAVAAPVSGSDAATKTYVDSGLGGSTLDLTGLANNQTLKWSSAASKWVVATPNAGTVTSVTAAAPISIGGTAADPVISLLNTAVTPGSYGAAGSVGTFTVDAQGRLTAAGSTPILIMADQISSAAGKYLSYRPNNVACADQQVLKWDNTNSRWTCANDAGAAGVVTSVTVSGSVVNSGTAVDPILSVADATTSAKGVVQLAAGGGTTAGTVVQANDARLSDSRAPSGSAGGDLTGSYPNPTLATSGVTSGAYGSASQVGTFTVDTKGRLTAAGNTSIAITADQVINSAGKYFGYAPNNVACADQGILKWDNTNSRWICGTDSDAGGDITAVTVGTGISGGGASGSVAISLANTTVTPGSYGAPGSVGTFTVDAQGRLTAAASTPILIMADQISSAAGKYFSYRPNNVACADQEILKWDATNSRWICAADTGGIASESDPTVTAWAKAAPAARLSTTGNVLDLTASGVSAGTYSKVTVDTYGRVTASSSLTASDISTALGFNPLNKAGDTMTGLLVLSADPSANLGAATKQYVDSAVSSAGGNYVRKDGTVAFTGDQSMGSNRMIAVAAPVSGTDAANKAYVDGNLGGSNLDLTGLANNQSVKWNSAASKWIVYTPNAGAVTSVTAAAPISVGGTAADPVISLLNTAVTPGSYGSAGSVGTFTVDAQGRLTAATATAISITADQISNASGKYLAYKPNNVACSDQQVLKWDNTNSRWACANDAGAAGVVTSVSVSGAVVNNGTANDPILFVADASTSGKGVVQLAAGGGTTAGTVVQANDARLSDSRAPSGSAGGDLTGSYPNPTLVTSGVTSGAYGSASQVGTFTVDTKGRLTAAASTAIAITADQVVNGAGKYFGYAPNNVACADQGILKWDNTNSRWICGTDSDAGGDITSVSVATGISGGGTAGAITVGLTNTAVTAGSYGAAGSVGTFTVDAQGRLTAAASTPILIMADQISSAAGKYLTYKPNDVACADQQVLKWDNTNSRWSCGTDTSGVGSESDPTVAAYAKNAPAARFTTTSNILDLATSGVTAGTYTKVTVDTYGRVTTGANLTAGDISTALTFTPVNKAGDTMTGLLVLSADPSANLGASTKQYVDSAVSSAGGNYIRKDGTVAFTGDQSMGSNRMIAVAAPVSGTDAANKAYVDGGLGGNTLDLTGLANNQSVKWNSAASKWVVYTPSSGTVNSVTAAAPISIGGTAADPVVSLLNTAVTPGSYGSASSVGTFTVDAQGRLTAAGSTSILITASQISQSSATSGQVLKWNGSAWAPAADSGLTAETDPNVQAYAKAAPAARLVTTGNVLDLATSGVVSGSYSKVTVDDYGRVTSGGSISSSDVTTALGYTPVGAAVTSVGLALPAEITVTNSPVTTTGTLTGAWASQAAKKVFAAPAGSAGTPSFRSLTIADIQSSVAGGFLSGSSCTAGQALTYSSVTDTISCTSIVPAVTNATSLASAKIWVGDGSNLAQPVTLSGDATINNAGALSIANGAVTAAKLDTTATNGQLFIGNGSGFTKATLTSGNNVTITNAAGSITIATANTISSLGGQTGGTQTFANDTNVTMSSASNTHTLGWTGTLALSRGGTGAAVAPAGAGEIIYSASSSALGSLAAGTSGQILKSNGAGAPSWLTTLPVANGGTGNTTMTAGGILAGNGTSAVLVSAAGTSGQLLISGGSGVPTWSTVTADASGNVNAAAFLYTSDRRLKENFQDIKGLETILALHGVSFTWKSNGQPEIGLIAQEVEKVLPELVITNPKTGLKAVKYGNLVAPLIESVKELYGICQANQEKIIKLEEKVDQLAAENAELRNEIREIKNLLKQRVSEQR